MKSFGQKKKVRKMSYISDQEGIMNRYLRERENWNPHLENTKEFILGSFAASKLESVAILGSGWLLDLPIDALIAKYKKIILVDVFHPTQIRKKLENIPGVEFFETDLSGGGISFCWELKKMDRSEINPGLFNHFSPKEPVFPFEPDAFISLNILNQLDILLIEFLQKKKLCHKDTDLLHFRRIIQSFHIEMLRKKATCLISDIMEENTDDEGNIKYRDLLHVDLPSASRTEEWTWDFDLSKRYHKNMTTRMKVKALEW